MSDDNVKELLNNVLHWAVSFTRQPPNQAVLRKIVHCLVTFFVLFSRLWPNCVRHFLRCLEAGRVLPAAEAEDAANVVALAAAPTYPGSVSPFRVGLWFARSLVEEVGKTDMNSPKQ